MKVLAINGSPRKGGNTSLMLQKALEPIAAAGIETELVELHGRNYLGCIACMKCWERQDGHCAIKKDDLNDLIHQMRAADGLILGSPTYFANVTSNMKSIIDRAGMVALANGAFFARKVGGSAVAVRRGGAVAVFDAINHFYLINQVVVAGSSYWNLGRGLAPGDVSSDEEGMTTMENLGKNMAWVLGKLHA